MFSLVYKNSYTKGPLQVKKKKKEISLNLRPFGSLRYRATFSYIKVDFLNGSPVSNHAAMPLLHGNMGKYNNLCYMRVSLI